MSRWDTAVSAGAWSDLVVRYRALGGEDADDFDLAELLRNKIQEVEGE